MAVQQQTGVTPQMLLDAPALPEGCESLWDAFRELHACRGSGPQRITYLDIDAYQRVNGVRFAPWQLDAIRQADAAFLTDYAERNAGDV